MTFDSDRIDISYTIFNTSWDSFLLKRGIRNTGEYSDSSGRYFDSTPYRTYLRNSIASLVANGLPEKAHLQIVVLELEKNDTVEALSAMLRGMLPQERFSVRALAPDPVEHLIRYELERPQGQHRSPNNIHEWLIYHVALTSEGRFLLVVDADTLFLEPGFVESAFGLMRERGRAAAAFMDRSREVQRADGSWLTVPERMHTVLLAFDLKELRSCLDLQKDIGLQLDFEERTALLPPEAAAFFRRHHHADSLSFLTEELKGAAGGSRLLDLNREVAGYFEDRSLAIGCASFLHGKYLDPGLNRVFLERLCHSPGSVRVYQRMLNYLLSLPGS